VKERKMIPSPDSQAEIWETYVDSGYAPFGDDGVTGYPESYPGYDPRVSIYPFFPVIPVPVPLFPSFFFPPPFFPRRRLYW